MAHSPEWFWNEPENDCEVGWWEDLNRPDSDQFNGFNDDWLAVLASEGIHPPHHETSVEKMDAANRRAAEWPTAWSRANDPIVVGDRVRVVANVDDKDPELDAIIGELGTVIRVKYAEADSTQPDVYPDVYIVLDREPTKSWGGTVEYFAFLPIELARDAANHTS